MKDMIFIPTGLNIGADHQRSFRSLQILRLFRPKNKESSKFIYIIHSGILSARGTRALIHLAFCHYCHHYCHVAPFPQIRHFIISSVILVSESAS